MSADRPPLAHARAGRRPRRGEPHAARRRAAGAPRGPRLARGDHRAARRGPRRGAGRRRGPRRARGARRAAPPGSRRRRPPRSTPRCSPSSSACAPRPPPSSPAPPASTPTATCSPTPDAAWDLAERWRAAADELALAVERFGDAERLERDDRKAAAALPDAPPDDLTALIDAAVDAERTRERAGQPAAGARRRQAAGALRPPGRRAGPARSGRAVAHRRPARSPPATTSSASRCPSVGSAATRAVRRPP